MVRNLGQYRCCAHVIWSDKLLELSMSLLSFLHISLECLYFSQTLQFFYPVFVLNLMSELKKKKVQSAQYHIKVNVFMKHIFKNQARCASCTANMSIINYTQCPRGVFFRNRLALIFFNQIGATGFFVWATKTAMFHYSINIPADIQFRSKTQPLVLFLSITAPKCARQSWERSEINTVFVPLTQTV